MRRFIRTALVAAFVFLAPAHAVHAAIPAGEHTGRCGTSAILEARELPSAAQLSRPSDGTFTVESAHFVIHYYDGGLNTYAQQMSDAAELSWRVLIDTLGYAVPPLDGVPGGDSRVDYYILTTAEMGSSWGRTLPETFTGNPYPNSYTSWVEMVDTLSINRLQVVTAHELYHVIQLGFDADENISWLEMISTWVEDRVYDQHNLYLEVLPAFFNNPRSPLFGQTYSNVPWAKFLTENYDDNILREILVECGLVTGSNVRGATETVLNARTGGVLDFYDEFQRFTEWNFFTGARDDGTHYEEGATWPLVALQRDVDCLPLSRFRPFLPLSNTLNAHYFLIDGDYNTGSLRVVVEPEWFAVSSVNLVKFQGGIRITDAHGIAQFTLADTTDVGDWSLCDSMLVIYSIDTSDNASGNLYITASDPNETPAMPQYFLVLDRDDCSRPFDGVADQFTTHDGQERPFALALNGISYQFVQSDSIPPDLSACAGIFIIGGYDAFGMNLDTAELNQLMSYMDSGGDVYLEARKLGEFLPSFITVELNFWNYFGTDFTAGDDASTTGLTSWSIDANAPVSPMSFDYAARQPVDEFIGALTPSVADTLATDNNGHVRMTYYSGPNGSTRIQSTVLLGASTGASGATREGFLTAVVEMFGSLVPALAVTRMETRVTADGVTITGSVEGYEGQALSLYRGAGTGDVVEVPMRVEPLGGDWLLSAFDDSAPAGRLSYELRSAGLLLWQGSVNASSRVPDRLRLTRVFPNPTSAAINLVVESDGNQMAEVGIFDVAGRRVHTSRHRLVAGVNTLSLARSAGASLPAGVYFARLQTPSTTSVRKLMILR